MKACLLQILASDGLRSAVGLARAEPQLIGALRTCLRAGLVTLIRPGLKPTGYSRREVPTDVVVLTPAGREDVERCLDHPAPAVSLVHEIEHRVGVGELRTKLRVPLDAWTSAGELHIARRVDAADPVARGLPDGLADVNGMRLALEYDHGRYTAVQVRFKQQRFMHMADDAVWAAPTVRRARWLHSLGCEHVLVVPLPLGVWEGRIARPSASEPHEAHRQQ